MYLQENLTNVDKRDLFRAFFDEKVWILKYLARVFEKKIEVKMANNIFFVFKNEINNSFF